jgi:hypothetical protein
VIPKTVATAKLSGGTAFELPVANPVLPGESIDPDEPIGGGGPDIPVPSTPDMPVPPPAPPDIPDIPDMPELPIGGGGPDPPEPEPGGGPDPGGGGGCAHINVIKLTKNNNIIGYIWTLFVCFDVPFAFVFVVIFLLIVSMCTRIGI